MQLSRTQPFSELLGFFLLLLLLVLLLLLQETTCSSLIREQKLMEFQTKIAQREASSPTTPTSQPVSPSLVSRSKQNGRVFYPIGYGADPTGKEESSDAILCAINDAFQLKDGTQLVRGVSDLGGVVIDFQGGNFKISKPIRFPDGVGNIVVEGGTLRASEQFPEDRHLVELWSPRSQLVLAKTDTIPPNGLIIGRKDQGNPTFYEDITFRDILFDSSYKGGGIFIIDSARIRINNCFFLHFTTEGILVHRGHETFVSNCFLGQKSTVGGDPGEKDFTGTGIDLAGNDNAVTDVAIFSGAIGVLLRGQANIVTGVHCYNKATFFGGIGILVKLSAALTRIDNCYLDYNAIVMEDPVQVHVTNGLFLGDGNVVLKSVNGKISGVTIVNNMFNGDPKNMVPMVKLDGTFSSIDQVVIDQNDVKGLSLKSTVGKLTVAVNGTKWVADFSSLLVFPNKIDHFHYSFFLRGESEKFPLHAVTYVSNNVVVVESNKEVNGVVSVVVDQYNMAGESSIVM